MHWLCKPVLLIKTWRAKSAMWCSPDYLPHCLARLTLAALRVSLCSLLCQRRCPKVKSGQVGLLLGTVTRRMHPLNPLSSSSLTFSRLVAFAALHSNLPQWNFIPYGLLVFFFLFFVYSCALLFQIFFALTQLACGICGVSEFPEVWEFQNPNRKGIRASS